MGGLKNEIGNVYGYLTVIERAENTKDGRAQWLCQCKCGNTTVVLGKHLRSGNTKSCGCYQKERATQSNLSRTENLVGKKFLKLTVLSEAGFSEKNNYGKRDRIYECLCDCGNICEANGNFLKCGSKKSCGCLISQGEYEIESILKENNIPYIKEKSLDDLTNINGNKLRFDFIIYNKDNSINRCVEFDGIQHFTGPDTRVWGRTTDTLETIQERDSIKNKYCKDNNIILIRIPYIKLTKITLEDIMGDKFQVKE